MGDEKRRKANQVTLLMIADEFLIQYLSTNQFRNVLPRSRLFGLGHCLELYLKSYLASTKDMSQLITHDLQKLIEMVVPSLTLTEEEIEAGKELFSPVISNFDLGLYEKHKPALELYVTINFLKDLKYYVGRNGEVLFPAIVSTMPINPRFIDIIREVRKKIPSIKHLDEELKNIILELDPSGDLLKLLDLFNKAKPKGKNK